MKHKILLFLLGITALAYAQTATVNGTEYTTISDAHAAASGGDIIYISGFFDEIVTMNKAVSLVGNDPLTDGIISTGSGRVIIYNTAISGDFEISNLTISGGNATGNGAGININKCSSSSILLKNLIVENNTTTAQGGGLTLNSANITMTDCIIRNNSAKNGGGLHLVSNNVTSGDKTINIHRTLVTGNNSSLNGAGVYVFAGSTTIGLTVNIENSTIALNTAGQFGGIGWVNGNTIASTNVSNTTVNMTHVTAARNTAAQTTETDKNKFGLYFSKNGANGPKFNAYNSIFVAAGVPGNRGINFSSGDPDNFINNVVGGQVNKALLDVDLNNLWGRTAGQIGLANALSDEGGFSKVMAISTGTDAENHCSESTGTTLPTVDQRGYNRSSVVDAGAYEIDGTLSNNIKSESLLELYPNPASNTLHINSTEKVNSYTIHNLLGKTVESQSLENSEIDISNLVPGTYFISIKSAEKQTTLKFIKL